MILNKECWWLADTSTIHTSKYNKNALNVTFCKRICSRNIENNYEHYKIQSTKLTTSVRPTSQVTVSDQTLLQFIRTSRNKLSQYHKWIYLSLSLSFYLSLSMAGGCVGSVCSARCPAASWKAMDFDVFGQVIAAGKFLLTDRALVGLNSRVRPAMPWQLVRPGESARTIQR